MKKSNRLHWEQSRPLNLKIGFAASLLLTLAAFNWTSMRPGQPPAEPDFLQQEPEIKVMRTAHATPPKALIFKPAAKIVEVPELTFSVIPLLTLPHSALSVNDLSATDAAATSPTALPPSADTESPAPELPFRIVEEMPRFPGCESQDLTKEARKQCADSKLLEYLANHIVYPSYAREVGIEGIVVIRFVVEKDGSITGAGVVRDIGGGCGKEALRVVQSMPDWIAGKQRGRAVRVQFDLPVRFRLR